MTKQNAGGSSAASTSQDLIKRYNIRGDAVGLAKNVTSGRYDKIGKTQGEREQLAQNKLLAEIKGAGVTGTESKEEMTAKLTTVETKLNRDRQTFEDKQRSLNNQIDSAEVDLKRAEGNPNATQADKQVLGQELNNLYYERERITNEMNQLDAERFAMQKVKEKFIAHAEASNKAEGVATPERSGTSSQAAKNDAVAEFMDNMGITEAEIKEDPSEFINMAQNEVKNLAFLEKTTNTPERKEEFRQRREQIQARLDLERGKSPETTRKNFQKLVDMHEDSPKFRARAMEAFDVRQKNYPIPDTQERTAFPPKVVAETDKAYKVKNTNPTSEMSDVYIGEEEYVPKSRSTVKDGYMIGVEGWLKKKMRIPVD